MPRGRLLRLNRLRGPCLRARRSGRHSARGTPCGPADVWMASVPRRPRWLAVRPSGPSGLVRLVRPLPDGRCARHPAPCPGAARCGQGGRAPGVDIPRQRSDVAGRWHGGHEFASTALGASTVVRGALRSATPGGGRRIPATAAGRDEDRTEGTTGGTRRAHSESCRPAGSALDRVSPAARRAETRSPQRGRRAGDAHVTRGRRAGDSITQKNLSRTLN